MRSTLRRLRWLLLPWLPGLRSTVRRLVLAVVAAALAGGLRSTLRRLKLAVAAAAVAAGLQVWGWGDAVRALGAGVGWLWRGSWPAVRVAVPPVAAAGALYLAASTAGRRWWRSSPFRAAYRFAHRAWVPLSVAITVALLAGLVLLAPGWLVAHDTAAGTLTAEERAKATSDARTALLQAVGGLLLAAGAAATWRQVRISREGQVTERFTRAVDQLGSEHLDVRLGALYALGRIARDSPGDRRTIAEVLTAYIRQRAPWPPTQPGQYRADWPLDQQPDLRTRAPDVQAAFTVLGRGPFPKPVSYEATEADRLDLRTLDLRRADLHGANLHGARLGGANLHGARLRGADLRRAVLDRADLRGAVLDGADLRGAVLNGADLQSARLVAADLRGANFFFAKLQGAQLGGADLQGAVLVAADLQGAVLRGAKLQGAQLGAANLQGADLIDANLQGANLIAISERGPVQVGAKLRGALGSSGTVWPAGFSGPEWGVFNIDGEQGVFNVDGEPPRPPGDAQPTAGTDVAARPTERETAELPIPDGPRPRATRNGSDGNGEPVQAPHND